MKKTILCGSFCVLASLASAASIFSTGFESPTYTANTLLGSQGGWQGFNTADSDAVVTANPTEVASGTQAVELVPTVGSNQTGFFHADTASGSPLIDLSADIIIFSSGSESQWQFAGLGAGLTPFIGGIDLTPASAGIDSVNPITLGYPAIGTITLDSFHHYDLLFNFSSQTYSVTIDGTTLASNLAFCTDNGPCTAGGNITEGQFLSFFDVFANISSNDFGAIDNLALSSVPEPSTYGLTGAALVAGAYFLRRARKA